jgi:hypothetical protein
LTQIAPESRGFLIGLFTDLRDDLEDQPGSSGRAAIYAALLAGLEGGEFPDDEAAREYVAGLARATDEENEYAQAVLEHRALEELGRVLTARSPALHE